MLSVTKRFRFEAAHLLPYYNGKCKNLHGHGFDLEIEVSGEVLRAHYRGPTQGMIIDFSDLKRLVETEVIDILDHHYLNEVIEYDPGTQPTAEETVLWIVTRLQKPLSMKQTRLERVTLYETPDNCATWRRDAD
jgi:6-pyruvoyltetrahydropterin/6-carboxytetrahydropterin synthase